MVEPKLKIHIGYPRTGTTSLQKLLHSSRSELEGAGIFFPETIGYRSRHLCALGKKEVNGKIANLLGIEEPTKIDQFARNWLGRIKAEAEGYQKIIFSEETISTYDVGELELFASQLHDFFDEIEIVVCFREHLSFITSDYSQRVRASFYHGSINNFAKVFSQKTFSNYCQVMKNLISIFGEKKVHVFCYSKSNSLESIYKLMTGIELGARNIENSNESMSEIEVELKRKLNQPFKEIYDELLIPNISKNQSILKDLVKQIVETSGVRTDLVSIPEKAKIDAKILEVWRDDWRELSNYFH